MIQLTPQSLSNPLIDPGMRRLLAQRFDELGDEPMVLMLVECGDTLPALEQATGCPIAQNLFDDTRFPHEGFCPSFEYLLDHGVCFEMVFIVTDDGGGTALFIPHQSGIDADLLALCQTYAESSITMPKPLDPLVADLVDRLDDNLREAFEERAGIIEFDANLPRAHAECLALLNVLVSHPEAALRLFTRK